MTNVLRQITQRACALFEAEATNLKAAAFARKGTSPSESVRFLAVSCNALCSLAHFSANKRDNDYLAISVVTTTQQLISVLASLSESASTPPEVLATLFKIAKQALPVAPPATVSALLRQLDRRISPTTFVLWGPHQQLQCLYTMAKATAAQPGAPATPLLGTATTTVVAERGASASSFSMLQDLLLCISRELGKLSESEAALLLWSLATLKQQHSSCWGAACQRCQFLLRRMNRASQATVLHAALLSDSCTCEAQQQLMSALLETSSLTKNPDASWFEDAEEERDDADIAQNRSPRERAENGERAAASSLSMRWMGVDSTDSTAPFAKDDDDAQTSFNAIRSRLLRGAHSLTTDTVLSLLPHLARQSFHNDRNGGTVDFEGNGEVRFLVNELARRSELSAEQSVRVLRDVVLPYTNVLPLNAAGESEPVRPYAERQLSALAMTALGTLVQAEPSAATRPQDLCLCLSTVLCFISRDTDGLKLLLQLNADQRTELFDSVIGFTQELLRRTHSAFGVLDGESLCACASACDVVMNCNDVLEGSQWRTDQLSAIRAESEHIIASMPSMWQRRSERELYEQAAAVIATTSAHERLFSLNCSCLSSQQTPSLSKKLLLGCASTLSNAAQLPVSVIARVLVVVESMASTSARSNNDPSLPADVTTQLSALSKRLILFLESAGAATSHASLLAEVEALLTQGAANSPTSAPVGRRNPPSSSACYQTHFSTIDALLDLYIRLLQRDKGNTTVTRQSAAVLVQCLQQRANVGPEALERGFMVLCTRRLGQKESFLKEARLPPGALVALIRLAEEHLGSGASGDASQPSSLAGTTILAALIEHILPSTGDSTSGVVPQCNDLATLNDIASLLSFPTCVDLGLREPLARALTKQAIRLAGKRVTPPTERALLIAYFVRANMEPSEELLCALRSL